MMIKHPKRNDDKMTINRNHPALINNDDTIFDLSIDETVHVINNLVAVYAARLNYVMTNISDSHADDFNMIQPILTQLMTLTTYDLMDLTDEDYSERLETIFTHSVINDILYFEHYNNCALTTDDLLIMNHFNKLTDDQLDALINN